MKRWDTIQVGGSPMRVYLAAPDGVREAPAVMIAQHGPGVDRFIEDRAEALAAEGFCAAAPDLYHRQPADGGDMMAKIGRLRDAEIVADMNATIEHAKQLPDIRIGKVGVIGFCMGGRVSYLMAGSNASLGAAGVFYGGNIMKPWGDGPAPFALTSKIRCPMIGFFGVEDKNPSPDDVKAIDAELTRKGKVHAFHSYDDAGHAFLNFTNPAMYRERQAKDAWSKLIPFLKKHLA